MMMIAGLAFVATLAFEIPFAKLEAMLIGGNKIVNNLYKVTSILFCNLNPRKEPLYMR